MQQHLGRALMIPPILVPTNLLLSSPLFHPSPSPGLLSSTVSPLLPMPLLWQTCGVVQGLHQCQFNYEALFCALSCNPGRHTGRLAGRRARGQAGRRAGRQGDGRAGKRAGGWAAWRAGLLGGSTQYASTRALDRLAIIARWEFKGTELLELGARMNGNGVQ